MKLVFFETPAFTRLLPAYVDDESYRELQQMLLDYPERGDLMPGTGGFRGLSRQNWKPGDRNDDEEAQIVR